MRIVAAASPTYQGVERSGIPGDTIQAVTTSQRTALLWAAGYYWCNRTSMRYEQYLAQE
jgi:hypothetical protein